MNHIKLLDVLQSVETVYQNAVQKHNSSSSEDDIMEISGIELDNDYSNFVPSSEFRGNEPQPYSSRRDEPTN